MHPSLINTTGNFSQLIITLNPSYYPLPEDSGIVGTATTDGASHIQ